MAQFDAANARLFKNIFVCRKCMTKMRAPTRKVSQGLIKCRKCGSRDLRPKRRG